MSEIMVIYAVMPCGCMAGACVPGSDPEMVEGWVLAGYEIKTSPSPIRIGGNCDKCPRTPADALHDPRPGDVVKGVPREDWGAINTARMTCRVIAGECIAYTLNDSSDVYWMLKEWWAKPNRVCESYEVLHVAQEGGAL